MWQLPKQYTVRLHHPPTQAEVLARAACARILCTRCGRAFHQWNLRRALRAHAGLRAIGALRKVLVFTQEQQTLARRRAVLAWRSASKSVTRRLDSALRAQRTRSSST